MRLRWIGTALAALALLPNSEAFAQPLPAEDRIEARVSVIVSSNGDGVAPDERLPHARVLIIDRNGRIAANGLTDRNGEWRGLIRIPVDPRFSSTATSLVTVIGIADGFNEHVEFDVPLVEHADWTNKASVALRPIRLDARNEPSFNGKLHRFTVFGLLDDYAERAGLVKQKQLRGAEGFGNVDMPWSAKLK